MAKVMVKEINTNSKEVKTMVNSRKERLALNSKKERVVSMATIQEILATGSDLKVRFKKTVIAAEGSVIVAAAKDNSWINIDKAFEDKVFDSLTVVNGEAIVDLKDSNVAITSQTAWLQTVRPMTHKAKSMFCYSSVTSYEEKKNKDEFGNTTTEIVPGIIELNNDGHNRGTRSLPIAKNAEVLNGSVTVKKTANSKIPYIPAILKITIKDKDLIAIAPEQKVFKKTLGVYTKVYVALDNSLKNIVTGENAPMSEVFNADGSLKHGVSEYRYLSHTPASLKSVQYTLLKKEKDSAENYRDIFLGKVTLGSYTLYMDKDSSAQSNVKLAARFNAWASSSDNWGMINTWAWYVGQFANGGIDGTGFALDEFIAEKNRIHHGLNIIARAVTGNFIQARPDLKKGAFSVVTRNFMNALLGQYERVYVTAENKDEILNNIKKYSGKVLIFGELNKLPQVVVDSNVQKVEFDFDQISEFEVMDIAKVDNSWKVHGSIQMMQKPFDVDEEAAKKLISSLANTFMSDKIVAPLYQKKAAIPGFEEVRAGYPEAVINKIASDYILHDPSYFRGFVSRTTQTVFNATSKLAFEIEGTNRRVLADVASVFNLPRILKTDEVFIPGYDAYADEHEIAEEDRITTIMRYPMPENTAYHVAKVVSLKEIKARIAANKIYAKFADVIVEWYATLSKGTLVVAISKLVLAILGGMDFDFDMVVAVVNKAFNDIMKKAERTVIKIKHVKHAEITEYEADGDDLFTFEKLFDDAKNAKKQAIATVKSNVDGFAGAWIRQNTGSLMSVGRCTNINSTHDAFKYDLEAARKYFTEEFGGEGNKDKYVSIPMTKVVEDGIEFNLVEVDEDVIDSVIDRMKSVKLTDANLKLMLQDLQYIYRFYQETIIDSAKTGLNADVKIKPGARAWARHLNWIEGKADWNNGKFVVTEETRKNQVDDTLSLFKEYFTNRVSKFMEEKVMALDIKPTEDMIKAWKNAKLSNADAFVNLNEIVKSAYRAFSRKRSEALEAAGADEARRAKINEDFKAELEWITNLSRQLTPSMSAAQRGTILRAVGNYNGQEVSEDGSQLANMICKEEFIAAVSKMNGSLNVCGQRLIANKGYVAGDIVNFVHGQAGKAMILADYTGELEIMEYEGSLYAVKLIADELDDMIANQFDDSYTFVVLKNEYATEEVKTAIATANEVRLYARFNNVYSAVVADGVCVAQFMNESKASDVNGCANRLYAGLVGVAEEIPVFTTTTAVGKKLAFGGFRLNIKGIQEAFAGKTTDKVTTMLGRKKSEEPKKATKIAGIEVEQSTDL